MLVKELKRKMANRYTDLIANKITKSKKVIPFYKLRQETLEKLDYCEVVDFSLQETRYDQDKSKLRTVLIVFIK